MCVCVCVCLSVCLGGDNLWFDDLRAECIEDRVNIVFSPDVIICG